MTKPSRGNGTSAADRVPMSTSALPSCAARHISKRSLSLRAEWYKAILPSIALCTRAMVCGVNPISGTKNKTCCCLAMAFCISRRYTSVFPEPVTPCNKNTENPLCVATARIACSCSSVKRLRVNCARPCNNRDFSRTRLTIQPERSAARIVAAGICLAVSRARGCADCDSNSMSLCCCLPGLLGSGSESSYQISSLDPLLFCLNSLGMAVKHTSPKPRW